MHEIYWLISCKFIIVYIPIQFCWKLRLSCMHVITYNLFNPRDIISSSSSSSSSSRTDLSTHFQQPIARTDLPAHFQQSITSQLLFHSFNNIQRKREDRREWSRSLGATIGITTTTHRHHYPPNSYRWKGGGRKEGRKNLRKLSHTHTHTHLENTNRKINN